MQHLRRKRSNTWKAHLVGMGEDEQQMCYNVHVSLEMLCQISFMDRGEIEILEEPLSLLSLKTLRRLGYHNKMMPDKTFPIKSSTLPATGAAAFPFECRR